jgi:hypothetical protein
MSPDPHDMMVNGWLAEAKTGPLNYWARTGGDYWARTTDVKALR